MITIGQIAGYAGVTIKAVRHYHRRGLLDEPARDASGYRRYTAEHVVRLIKIKTLTEAGVPLARIKELLAATPDRFAAAAIEIDHALQERIEELNGTRERVAQLHTGDRLFVPAHVAGFLDLLQELGVSRRGVQIERDAWILVHSAAPDQAAALLAQKRAVLADPEFRAIYLEFDAALEWSPHDPRLEPLADRLRRWTAARSAAHGSEPVEAARHPALDPVVARLIAASPPPSPAWRRLMDLTGQ